MRRNCKGNALLAMLLVLVMLLCSFPVVCAEDAATDLFAPVQESVPETEPESVTTAKDPEAEPVPAAIPEEDPEAEPAPAEVPEEDPEAEPVPTDVPEEEPEAEPVPADVPEEAPETEPAPADVPEEEPEAEYAEEASEETIYEFDDDEVGSVSEELLEIFNNPDTYERIEFTGTVDIELKNSEICYDRDVTLVARVTGADMDYRLVWEANDGSGWFAVASGDEYTFLLTPDIADREYRVVLFRVC